MAENSLVYKLILQSYTRTLLDLLRVCQGLDREQAARVCGITRPMLSQWTAGHRPMAPEHERALRHLLTTAMHEKRQTVATMPTAELPRFQHALMKTLVDLDGIVLAMEQEFARSKHADAAASNHFLATMPAATPTVEAMAYANARDAYAEQAALPGLWKAQAARNRALRALVDPVAAADVRGNVIDLLDYAEEVYGLAEHEALEDKGPKHRRRGRPKKRQEVKTK